MDKGSGSGIEMKLQLSKNSFWVVVPKTKVKKKNWGKGTELDWVEYPNGDLVLQEVVITKNSRKNKGV